MPLNSQKGRFLVRASYVSRARRFSPGAPEGQCFLLRGLAYRRRRLGSPPPRALPGRQRYLAAAGTEPAARGPRHCPSGLGWGRGAGSSARSPRPRGRSGPCRGGPAVPSAPPPGDVIAGRENPARVGEAPPPARCVMTSAAACPCA